ncbi:hypothetical protein ABIB44_003844 [Hymenobacter sp. UYCo722]
MVLLVFLLFCSCLACLRECVWTKYTASDVARWHAQSANEMTVSHQPLPAQRLVVPCLYIGN